MFLREIRRSIFFVWIACGGCHPDVRPVILRGAKGELSVLLILLQCNPGVAEVAERCEKVSGEMICCSWAEMI